MDFLFENPTKIIIPVWIATICAAVSGITLTKILLKIKNLHFFPLTIYNLIFILSPYIIIRYNVYAIMT